MASQLEFLSPSHWDYSSNQRGIKYRRDMAEQGFDRKAEKSKLRKRREEQFLREFPKMQFNRALGEMLNGTATEENIEYVFRNAHNYERVIARYETENKTTVTVAIIELTPPNSKNLS